MENCWLDFTNISVLLIIVKIKSIKGDRKYKVMAQLKEENCKLAGTYHVLKVKDHPLSIHFPH